MKNIEVKVGIFVLITLAILLGLVIALSSSSQLFRKTYFVRARFHNVQGLTSGAPVRLAGVTVGRVDQVRFAPTLGEKNIEVRLALDERVRGRVREDSTATILTIGLLGDKYVELSMGSEGKRVLEEGDYIEVREPTDFYAILEKGNQIIDNTVKISSALETILEGFAQPEARRSVQESFQSLRDILVEVREGKGFLHSLVYEPSPVKIDEMAKKVSRAADSFASLNARLDKMTKEVAEGKGLLHTLIYKPDRGQIEEFTKAARSIKEASDAISTLTKDIARSDGLLHSLIYPPEKGRPDEVYRLVSSMRQAADSFNQLSGRLNEIANQITSGRGLLHSMIYEDRAEILKNASDASKAVRDLIADIKRNEGLLNTLIYGGKEKDPLTRLNRVAQGLEDVVREIKEGEGLLSKAIYDKDSGRVVKNLTETTSLMNDLIRETREGKGLLPALLFDPKGRETLKELERVAKNLGDISNRINSGEGTVGALVQDPSVYEDLKSILGGARRSALLRFLIKFVGSGGKENEEAH